VAQATRLRLAQIARLPVVHIRAINDTEGRCSAHGAHGGYGGL